MPSYTAPVRELRFVLHELLAITECTEIPGYGDVSDDLVDAVLDGGAKIAEEIWAPLNQIGDEEGCRFENGVVRTPPGFKQAFDAWYEGGWNAISSSPDWGGQGLHPRSHLVHFIRLGMPMPVSLIGPGSPWPPTGCLLFFGPRRQRTQAGHKHCMCPRRTATQWSLWTPRST